MANDLAAPLGRCLLVGVMVFGLSAPSRTRAEQPDLAAGQGSFRARTTGLPLSSVSGQWLADDEQASLQFAGGHAVGKKTSFVAKWKTGVLPGARQLEGSATVAVAKPKGAAPVTLRWSLRYRTNRGEWSRWITDRSRFSDEINVEFGGESTLIFSDPRNIQYEWRLAGELKSPATLIGAVELTTQ